MVTAHMCMLKMSGGPEEQDKFRLFQSLTKNLRKNEKNKNYRIDHHSDNDIIQL